MYGGADMTGVGTRIRSARIGAGYSQSQLAEKVHVRRQAVNQWENGKANPTWENLTEVALACDVKLEELSSGSPQLEPLESAPQLKGWVSRRLAAVNQGLNEYLEQVIAAEVERRLTEELARYGLRPPHDAPPEYVAAVRDAMRGLEVRADKRHEQGTAGPLPDTAAPAGKSPARS